MVIFKATASSEKDGPLPDPQLLAEMGKFNTELINAGSVLAMDGLHPSFKGARVKFSGESRTVVDGPFTESKELMPASGSGRSIPGRDHRVPGTWP